jgi:hypothetical protein
MKEALMRPIMILSLAVLATIGGTNVVSSETIQQNSIEAAVLQLYHRKYDLARRLAAAALAKGDVDAAAKAASCANSNVFDDVAARFTPSADGITVTLRRVEEGKPLQQLQLTLPQFNEWLNGNAGQYDNVMEKGTLNILQQVAKGGGKPIEQQAPDQPLQPPIRSCEPKAIAQAPKPATQPAAVQSSIIAQQAQSKTDLHGPRQSWMPPPEPEYNMNTERGIRAQAERIYPWASQSEQRELWVADRMSEQLDREAGKSYTIRVKR